MTFRTPRLRGRRGQRLLSAALILFYSWAFAAVGLTHTHGARAVPGHQAGSRLAAAPSAVDRVSRPARQPADDGACPICAAVHAAAAALAQPPARVHALGPSRRFLTVLPPLIPGPVFQASRSRAPPQA